MSSQYNSFAADFSATRERSWPEFEMFFRQLRKGDRVLDLGCGNGRLRKFMDVSLIKAGDYFGFDMSDGLLGIARENYPEDHFFGGDFSKTLPFGADQFDVIAAVASFHHLLSKKDQGYFFRECRRVLKPGGKLFITTWILPHKYFWPNVMRGRFKNWIIPFGKDKHPRTYRRVSLQELKNLGKKAGFTVIEEKIFEGRNNVVWFER